MSFSEKTLLILAVLAFRCTGTTATSPRDRLAAAEVARTALAGRTEAVLTLMFFPDNETMEERERDKNGVRKSLGILAEDFGAVVIGSGVDEPPAVVSVGAGAGTVQYWSRHAKYYRFPYKAIFGKRGTGWVYIDVCDFSGKPAIRAVWYVLPRSSETEIQVKETMERLVNAVRKSDQ
jgi:hypothetical protein